MMVFSKMFNQSIKYQINKKRFKSRFESFLIEIPSDWANTATQNQKLNPNPKAPKNRPNQKTRKQTNKNLKIGAWKTRWNLRNRRLPVGSGARCWLRPIIAIRKVEQSPCGVWQRQRNSPCPCTAQRPWSSKQWPLQCKQTIH